MIDTIHLEVGACDTVLTKISFDYKKAIKSQVYYTLKQLGDVTILRSQCKSPFIEAVLSWEEIISLKLQLSVPKFLYWSSYYEFIWSDISKLYEELVCLLNKSFIQVELEDLKNIPVTRFAVCKNFYLPDSIGKPSHFLSQLQNVKLSPYYRNVSSTQFTTQSWNKKWYSIQSKSHNKTTTLYDKGQEIIAEWETKEELKIKKKLLKGLINNRVLRLETTYSNRSACRYAIHWQKSKKQMTLWHLLVEATLKNLLKKEVSSIIKIIKIKNLDDTDTFYQLEVLDKRIEATTLKESEKAQVFRYIIHLQQMGECVTADLFKSIFGNVKWLTKIRRIKRVIRNLWDKDLNKTGFTELVKFMEDHLFDLQTKKC